MKQFFNQPVSEVTEITYGTVCIAVVCIALFIAGTIVFINKKMA